MVVLKKAVVVLNSPGAAARLPGISRRERFASCLTWVQALGLADIVVNKNKIPFDPAPAQVTSGMRLGTPALTTRGMREPEMKVIADMLARVIENAGSDSVISEVRAQVEALTDRFPLYENLRSSYGI